MNQFKCHMEIQCVMTWEGLEKTDDPEVRYCFMCKKNVYWVNTPKEFYKKAFEGKCVASFFENEPPSIGVPSCDYR